jgi:hypothetical protein
MVIEKKKPGIVKESQRKLVAFTVANVAIILVALVGVPLHLPQAAIESTQWALIASLGIFSGANVGEHFANKSKLQKEEP